MKHDALSVADWFLARAKRDGQSVGPMKLQKLIYFAHGWSLALTGEPLIKEHPEAWNYGPVIPSVYYEFKRFGRDPITDDVRLAYPLSPRVEDRTTEKLLERIWQVYGGLSGIQLSNMTHKSEGAWRRTYDAAAGRMGADIPDEAITQEFAAMRAANRGAHAAAT